MLDALRQRLRRRGAGGPDRASRPSGPRPRPGRSPRGRRTSSRGRSPSSSSTWTAARRRSTPSTRSPVSTASTAGRSGRRSSRPSSTTSATCCGRPGSFGVGARAGFPVSDLFPHVGGCVDDLAIVRSMVSNFSEHTNANYFLHTCHGLQGRPSAGAWVTYGLGSENQDLPGFVVLNGGLVPPGGLDCFGSGFLPASYQGSVFKPSGTAVANIEATEPTAAAQRRKLDLLRSIDGTSSSASASSTPLEAAIGNYELAFRMQAAVPDLTDLAGESAATRRLYGFDEPYRADPDLRPPVPAGPPARRAWRPLRRADLPEGRRRPLGPARQPEGRPREQRPRRRPADRRAADGPEGPRPARLDPRHLGRRVRPDPDGPGDRRPRSQPLRLHHLARRRRHQGGHHPRRDRRLRLSRRRGPASRSTTCTRRCSTCSASTTPG